MTPAQEQQAHKDLLDKAQYIDQRADLKLSVEDEHAFVTVSCVRDIHRMHEEMYLHALRHSKLAEFMEKSCDMEVHLQVIRE